MTLPVRRVPSLMAMATCAACFYLPEDAMKGLGPGDVTAAFQLAGGASPAVGAVAALSAGALRRTADSNGRVTFRGLPEGDHILMATWDGNGDNLADQGVRVAFRIRVARGTRGASDLGVIQLSPTSTVVGDVRVFAGVGGCNPGLPAPAGTRVALAGYPSQADVVDGAFRMPGVAAGSYTVAAAAEGFLSDTQALVVGDNGGDAHVSGVLCLRDVSMQRATLTGAVLAAPNDQGLQLPARLTLRARTILGQELAPQEVGAAGFTVGDLKPAIYLVAFTLPPDFLPLDVGWLVVPPEGLALGDLLAWPVDRGDPPPAGSSSSSSSAQPSSSQGPSSASSRPPSSSSLSSSSLFSSSSSFPSSFTSSSSLPVSSSSPSSGTGSPSSGAGSSSDPGPSSGGSSSSSSAPSSSGCTPSTTQCSGSTLQTCDANGAWMDTMVCPSTCSAGACAALCVTGSTQCLTVGSNLYSSQACGLDGTWQPATPCSGATPFCAGGACVATAPSCKVLLDSGVTTSGRYTLDVDGSGPLPSFLATCDMLGATGGWTLVRSHISGGTAASVEGIPVTTSNIHLSPALMMGLAAVSHQVHIRTSGNASDSVTSTPDSQPIQQLRLGKAMHNAQTDPSCDAFPGGTGVWTGNATYLTNLRFSCCPQVGDYPNGVFHACNFGGGLSWFSTYGGWSFGASRQMELWFR